MKKKYKIIKEDYEYAWDQTKALFPLKKLSLYTEARIEAQRKDISSKQERT